MIFISYEPGSKAYRVYDPTTRRVHVSRDVVFDEAAQWAWMRDHNAASNDFIIEYSPGEDSGWVIVTTTMRVTM